MAGGWLFIKCYLVTLFMTFDTTLLFSLFTTISCPTTSAVRKFVPVPVTVAAPLVIAAVPVSGTEPVLMSNLAPGLVVPIPTIGTIAFTLVFWKFLNLLEAIKFLVLPIS